MTEYGLGRKPSPVDSRDYKMADVVAIMEAGQVLPKQWDDYFSGDQGQTNHCCGYGTAGWEACTPVTDPGVTNNSANNIYYALKALDGEPGNEDGSTVRTVGRYLVKMKRAGVYFFAASIAEAAQYVSHYGPVILGIDWTDGMFNCDRWGQIRPTGNVEGGHCILWYGNWTNKRTGKTFARLRNSWGTTWGLGGDCLIDLNDLQKLFDDGGEALAATELPLPKKLSTKEKIMTKMQAWLTSLFVLVLGVGLLITGLVIKQPVLSGTGTLFIGTGLGGLAIPRPTDVPTPAPTSPPA